MTGTNITNLFVNCEYCCYCIYVLLVPRDATTTSNFTVENLHQLLISVARKWRELGEILSLKEEILDEIFTNNNTDEACLWKMLVFYMMRSDLHHDWEEITNALLKMGEETLATEIGCTGKQQQSSYTFTLCSSPLQLDEASQVPESVPLSESTCGYARQANECIHLPLSVPHKGMW